MQHAREPLTSDEASRLANVCQTRREQLVVWTLLDLGLRADELASMKRGQIDWGSATIRIHGKGGPHGSHSKLRVVPITDRVRPLLDAHFALNETFGMSRRTIHRIVTAVGIRAEIARPCHPHVLRHTFAVTCLRRGISLPALQKLLGHSHLHTTAQYLNAQPEDVLREFREKWGRTYG